MNGRAKRSRPKLFRLSAAELRKSTEGSLGQFPPQALFEPEAEVRHLGRRSKERVSQSPGRRNARTH